MKEKYQKPIVDIVIFESEDVITTSGLDFGDPDPGGPGDGGID